MSADTTRARPTNYLGLTGKNVLVAVNDSGIDATHPDLTRARVLGCRRADLVDTNGHGTHVAGIIAGNGTESIDGDERARFASGSVTNADFRGKAPLANLFSMQLRHGFGLQLCRKRRR